MLNWTLHLRGRPERPLQAAVAVRPKVYSFGGDTDSDQIEVLVFNTVSLRWTELPPVTTGAGNRPLEVPSMRSHYTAVLIEAAIYIWGGVPSCDVLYAFDVDTHRWFMPDTSGAVPQAREQHSASVLGKVMYILGGWTLNGGNNDIYKMDTATMVWSLINPRGTPPPDLFRHSATIIGTMMFVFGGHAEHYNNVRMFDTETNCWMSVPSAQPLPEGRCAHSAFVYNGEMYIFGGRNFNHTLNDLWKFNPQTFSWKTLEPKGEGPRVSLTRMCYCCMVGDHIVVFGGWDTSNVNDLFILDLNPRLKMLCKLAVIQHGLEQSELPHDIGWELAAMTTNNNNKRKSNL